MGIRSAFRSAVTGRFITKQAAQADPVQSTESTFDHGELRGAAEAALETYRQEAVEPSLPLQAAMARLQAVIDAEPPEK